HVLPAPVTTAKCAPNFHARSRLGLLDGVEQKTQCGACPLETVETARGGGGWALGRRPRPRRLQRVERRLVTRRGEPSPVFLVGGRAPAPASARDGGPARRPNPRALSLRPGEKQARKLHGGASSVAGPRRRAAGRQLACARPVPVLEGLPPRREDRWPTQRLPLVRYHQHSKAGERLPPLAVLAVPSSPGHVGWRSASSLPPFLLGERASSVPSWQRQTRPSPPTEHRRMNQQYQRITQKSSK